jgi:hypothetical protein
MKARNKFEKRAAEVNAVLSEDIAVADLEWAKHLDLDGSPYVYFTIFSNICEFEVNRVYRLYRYDDKSTSHFFCVEILREFSDGEKKAYFSKNRFGMGVSYYDCFSFGSDIVLKDNRKNYAGNMLSYLMDYSVGSHAESDGSRVKCEHRDPNELARIICNNPVAETMYKENNPMFRHLMHRTYLKETCRAYTIARRHGFVFDDYSIPLWLDMVYAIIICKKDWHNPVYIAPKDLLANHDRFIRMMIRKEQENKLAKEYRRLEKERKQRRDLDELYVEKRKKFFGMILESGSLRIHVLQSVDEFMDEGTQMEHCVYKCRYWDMKQHPHSLIMSATIGGNRCETIEVDLKTYTIAQCYGKHDLFTNYHQQIVDFVNSQMDVIKAYNENRKRQLKKVA